MVAEYAREHAVYPGHPVVVALAIARSFPTMEHAIRPSGHGWPEAVGSADVPGAGDNAQAGCDLLRYLHHERWAPDDAKEWADNYWARCDGMGDDGASPRAQKRYKEGLEQAERLWPQLLACVEFWAPMRLKEVWVDTRGAHWVVEGLKVEPAVGVHTAVRRDRDRRRKRLWPIPKGWKPAD